MLRQNIRIDPVLLGSMEILQSGSLTDFHAMAGAFGSLIFPAFQFS
jgi:hypothetical protein